MLWDWLDRIINWREIKEQRREMDQMVANWDHMRADIDRRIRANFTPEEWASVSERCEARLAQWIEHGASTTGVAGSNPAARTNN